MISDTLLIGCVSQKGGVGKSSLARLVAQIYAAGGWDVKIADLNVKQRTSVNWVGMRMAAGVTPEIAAEPFPSVKIALRRVQHDLIVLDGAPDSHESTLDVGRVARLVIIPTGVTVDDMQPQVLLAHELKREKIDPRKFLFVINKALDSDVAVADARAYIESAGYKVADNYLRMMTGYQIAQNSGRSLNETTYPSLNERAERLGQELVNRVQELEKELA